MDWERVEPFLNSSSCRAADPATSELSGVVCRIHDGVLENRGPPPSRIARAPLAKLQPRRGEAGFARGGFLGFADQGGEAFVVADHFGWD